MRNPIVTAVNDILNLENDPVGVAAWWVQKNGRLDARPVELLGTAREHEVIHAALAVVEPIG